MDWKDSIFSDGSVYFVSNPCPKKGETITISIRMDVCSDVHDVFLRTIYNGVEQIHEMSKSKLINNMQYYSCSMTVYEDVFHYHFYLAGSEEVLYYNQIGVFDVMPDNTYDFRIITNYTQPSWVKNAVFYQIFPDRFCNGNKDLDYKDNEYVSFGNEVKCIKDWNAAPLEYKDAKCMDFYGGDLYGVASKIDYLLELGVKALYINPIFHAGSVHRYDCLDHFNVDKHLGGNEALINLTKKLHDKGMKIMLDTSINHTGVDNKWFNKDGAFFDKSIGAYNNINSKEREYYFFNDKNEYISWFNVPSLPTLNYTNKELRKIIFEDKNSVVKKWLREPYNIDGWRFDVADTMGRINELQIHHEIWPLIKKSIREENNDAYVIGEDWCDCTEFLQGDEWDSGMNYYGFLRPVREFVGEQDVHNGRNEKLWTKKPMKACNLSLRIRKYLGKMAFVIQENQFNLLGSHDCSRLYNNPIISKADYKGAVIMLFTMIGSSNIYYGDEAETLGRIESMEGCRYPFNWDSNFKECYNYSLYHKLANMKNKMESFKGSFKVIYDLFYVFAYARFTDNECLVSIISMDDEKREVRINPSYFLRELKILGKDVFGTKICSHIDGSTIVISVNPHESLLFSL